jgi:hypothetical protein
MPEGAVSSLGWTGMAGGGDQAVNYEGRGVFVGGLLVMGLLGEDLTAKEGVEGGDYSAALGL